MRTRSFNREHTRTPYVQLNPHKCKACWKCIYECQNHVIGKVDFPRHKHALFISPGSCKGCLKCISNCPFGAYSKVNKTETGSKQKQIFRSFLINNLLLISGILMAISGFVLQFGFHFGSHNSPHHKAAIQHTTNYAGVRGFKLTDVWGIKYSEWSAIHKIAIVFFSLLMVYHIYAHWKWYKGIVKKQLVAKNLQAVILTILFVMVAITGLLPWFIDLSGNTTSAMRLIFIEVHDKLALILTVFLVLHLVKRKIWFDRTFLKLKQ